MNDLRHVVEGIGATATFDKGHQSSNIVNKPQTMRTAKKRRELHHGNKDRQQLELCDVCVEVLPSAVNARRDIDGSSQPGCLRLAWRLHKEETRCAYAFFVCGFGCH